MFSLLGKLRTHPLISQKSMHFEFESHVRGCCMMLNELEYGFPERTFPPTHAPNTKGGDGRPRSPTPPSDASRLGFIKCRRLHLCVKLLLSIEGMTGLRTLDE